MSTTKGEYKLKATKTKEIYHYRDPDEKIDLISREVFLNKDEVIHYPRGFEGKPKYKTIKRFVYKGFNNKLPVGIVKSPILGYGFTKTLNAFAFYINDTFEIEEVVIEKGGTPDLDLTNKKIYLSESNLATLQNTFSKLFEKNKKELSFFVQENLHSLYPSQVSKPDKTYVSNALAFSLATWGNSIDEFSENDKEAIKDLFEKLSINTDFLSSESLAKTKEIIDNKYIQKTLNDYKALMALGTDSETLEKKWQKFLKKNSWVFSSIFAQPIILHKDEAYVGGKDINNKNGKFSDFLMRNSLSENVSFLEIKTHLTKLVEKQPYRGQEVFSSSKDLTGCIVQVLNQRDNFQKEYYQAKVKSKETFETLNSKCVVLIGSIKDLDENQKNSFELFRSNSRDVEILTFDELENKISGLQQIMSGKVN